MSWLCSYNQTEPVREKYSLKQNINGNNIDGGLSSNCGNRNHLTLNETCKKRISCEFPFIHLSTIMMDALQPCHVLQDAFYVIKAGTLKKLVVSK